VTSVRFDHFDSVDVVAPLEVHGSVDARFAPVRDAFRSNFDRGEIGAACSVYLDGLSVVDLWGGWTDADRTRSWRRDTLVNAYSVGKPIAALQLLQLVAAGTIGLDHLASTVWPELRAAQAGATIRHVLSHRAGVPAIRRPLANRDLWDWGSMVRAVAETEPWWTPGTCHTYHANTYGFLVGELSRRRTGNDPGRWLREQLAGPLGADLAWGVAPADLDRCADIVWEGPSPGADDLDRMHALDEAQRMVALAYFNPPGLSGVGVVNSAAWRRALIPSANLHATADGVARVYAALARGGAFDGVVVLDRSVLAEATQVQSEGWCPVLEREVSFGLGFQPTRVDRPFGPNPGSYGHFGTGGAVGFADPAAQVAFGYVMNSVRPRWRSDRNQALIDTLYECL
jgi:CubicO group peptidase (beta-lactamase class C family)